MSNIKKQKTLYFDIETDGLLDTVTTVHCMSIAIDAGPVKLLTRPQDIAKAVAMMESEEVLTVAHNGIGFDLQVLAQLYGLDTSKVDIYDTLVAARLIFPDTNPEDDLLRRKGELPGKLMGAQSLESWGYRLGENKGDYSGGWETYNEEMGEYCIQDTVVLRKLYEHLTAQEVHEEALKLEHEVEKIIQRQVRHGIKFNSIKAAILCNDLEQHLNKLEAELSKEIQPWYQASGKVFTPKRDNKRLGYVEGAPHQKITLTHFNPGSSLHIIRYLERFNWVPTKLTESGNPSVDEEVLSGLTYPLVDKLLAHRLIKKRVGMLSEGRNGWMRLLQGDRIHGSVNTNGAVTGRMSHSRPNLTQVPSVSHGVDENGVEGPLRGEAGDWGYDMRELFEASPGKVLVGCDASGLELRMLAHFMYRYDGGEYAREIVEGDIHTKNQLAAGLDCREVAKTFIYGFL